MKVTCNVGGQKMEITCGKGGQSLRWLALVASQRVQLMQPKGRQRMRESEDARRGFALPKAVRLKNHGDLDDPHATISDVLEDGAEVEVVLMDAVQVDGIGAPVASEWFLKAFGSGDGTKRRLNGIRMRDEHEAKMAADAEATAIGRGGRGRARSPGSNSRGGFDVTVEGVAISGPLETSGEIRVAMEHDWRSADIGGLVDDQKEAVMVKGLLQRHLPTLNRVHASSSGGRMGAARGGAAAIMYYNDFAHACHRYGVLPIAHDAGGQGWGKKNDDRESKHSADGAPFSRAVFEQAANRGKWPGDGRVLSRSQFLGALVLVARGKEGGVAEALREILEDTLVPKYLEAISDGAGADIGRPEVQCYISDNRNLLHSVYLLYAEPSEDGAFISLDHFRQLMDDCGVMSAMTATSNGRRKFDFQSETCFFEVQGNPPLPSLVFTECIEAACRFGFERLSRAELALMTAEGTSPNQPHQPGTPAESSGSPPQLQDKELNTIYLVLDCIIDLGLGDRGLGDNSNRD